MHHHAPASVGGSQIGRDRTQFTAHNTPPACRPTPKLQERLLLVNMSKTMKFAFVAALLACAFVVRYPVGHVGNVRQARHMLCPPLPQ